MLRSYLTTALRLMLRDRAHTIIHLVGLALGLGTCLVIGQFVRHELSFDSFHENGDQLVRVLSTAPGRTPGVDQPSTLGPTLLDELPGVEAFVRFDGAHYDLLMSVGETRDYENGLIYAAANVFEEFSFRLQQGDPESALVEPYSIVITPAIAQKYFGDSDPFGRQIRLRDRMDLTVTGIVTPPPAHSSIQFDMIGSFATQRELQWMIRNNPWNLRSFATYLRLAKGVDREAMQAAIPSLLAAHTQSESVINATYKLEPLRSIYLNSIGGDTVLCCHGTAGGSSRDSSATSLHPESTSWIADTTGVDHQQSRWT